MKMQSLQDQKTPCVDVMLVNKEVVLKADDAMITNRDEIIHKDLNDYTDEIIHKDLNDYMEVDIPIKGEHGGPPVKNNTINTANDQDSSEDEEATESDQSSSFADVVEDVTWVESQVLVKDPHAVSTDNDVLNVDDLMLKSSNGKTVIAKTFEELSIHEPGAIEILSSRCHMNEIHVTALNNKVQTLQSDMEIVKTNLNKAEEKVKLLSEENRTLSESNKRLLRSERENSARNSTKRSKEKVFLRDSHLAELDYRVKALQNVAAAATVIQTFWRGGRYAPVQYNGEHGGPLANNTNMNNNTPGDQEFSEGEEPTELDPKDKGVFNFMKPVSSAALAVISPLSFAGFALVGSAGYPTISKSKKECLLLSTGVFFLFSLITCGVVHALDGRAKDIDLAATMVIAEIAYLFLVLCLDAMFFLEAPWFIIPVGLFLWLVLTGWLLWRFRRPRGLYTLLRMLKRFLLKTRAVDAPDDEAMTSVSSNGLEMNQMACVTPELSDALCNTDDLVQTL